jgi:hypothetical protein
LSRDPSQGKPATVFRYDLIWEFVSAIVDGRSAVPSFHDGLNARSIADAVLESHARAFKGTSLNPDADWATQVRSFRSGEITNPHRTTDGQFSILPISPGLSGRDGIEE